MSNIVLTKKEEEEDIRLHLLERLHDLLIGAFSLVAALAWNDAVQSLFKKIFGDTGSLIAKFAYAMFVTLLTVWVMYRLTKMTKKLRKHLKNEAVAEN